MKVIRLFCCMLLFSSCFKPKPEPQKVWGNKPVFALRDVASEIKYIPAKQPVQWAGNIYAYGSFIFQMEIGKGIHVIDNRIPKKAERIGFITVNGCDQISIKQNYLYTNSYADLVTIDISDASNIREVSRVKNAFPSARYAYPYFEPTESGYYDCNYYSDSVVVEWVKDSIYRGCYKY